jgi:microcystin degradation protein MlrC
MCRWGAELDLHCHFSELMRTSADAIICFKEYPHTDGRERAEELYKILIDTVESRVRPVTAVFDCKMVGPWHTTRAPMASFLKKTQSHEGTGRVLSVMDFHGATWQKTERRFG